jgi:hypothetical protein
MSAIDDEMETIETYVPAGIKPGESMNVQTEDGRIFSVVVPEGLQVGDKLRVSVSHSSGSSQVMSHNKEYSDSQKSIGAAAAGAVIGTLLLGPIVGVVVAGVAVYATTRDDKIGDVSRSVGMAAMSVFDKGSELATKYQVKEKLSAAGNATVSKFNEIDSEYHVRDKVSEGASVLAAKAKELDAKHGISSKAASLVTSGVAMAATEMFKASTRAPSSTARK